MWLNVVVERDLVEQSTTELGLSVVLYDEGDANKSISFCTLWTYTTVTGQNHYYLQ